MANVKFHYTEPGKPEPIYFEQIYAEKPGGGLVKAPAYDIKPTTALGEDADGNLQPIKCAVLTEDAAADAATIKVAKGSGFAKGDFIATGKVAVAITKVDDTTSEDYDVITAKLGVKLSQGTRLYQASAAADGKETFAVPIYTPKYVAGDYARTGDGDQLIKLVNGANLRKETALIANEVAALLPTIQLV